MKNILSIAVIFFASVVYAKNVDTKVIYNDDRRVEINNELPAELMQYIKQRTLAITHNANLFYQPGGEVIFMPRHYGRPFKLCEDERFFEQPSLANCTASVIGKDLVLTAGHCISENNCRFMKFIADFVMQDDGKNPIKTMTNNIYSCKKLIYENDDPVSDVAVIQLDREFPLSPLLLSEKQLDPKDELLAIGFPSGIPMKSSGLGPIRKITETLINAELETYGGNSGSPIFKKDSNVVEGILVAGEDDFVKDEAKKCYRSNVCNSSGCSGEDIISAQLIRDIFKTINQSN